MALSQREQDIQKMLAAQVHLGTKQCDFQMERYVYRRRQDGIFVINLGKTWEKLQLAARVIVAIENPQDVVVQSARPYAQRAVLKFAQYTGAKALAGRYTPGDDCFSQRHVCTPEQYCLHGAAFDAYALLMLHYLAKSALSSAYACQGAPNSMHLS